MVLRFERRTEGFGRELSGLLAFCHSHIARRTASPNGFPASSQASSNASSSFEGRRCEKRRSNGLIVRRIIPKSAVLQMRSCLIRRYVVAWRTVAVNSRHSN